jgi:hypothetical protein
MTRHSVAFLPRSISGSDNKPLYFTLEMIFRGLCKKKKSAPTDRLIIVIEGFKLKPENVPPSYVMDFSPTSDILPSMLDTLQSPPSCRQTFHCTDFFFPKRGTCVCNNRYKCAFRSLNIFIIISHRTH